MKSNIAVLLCILFLDPWLASSQTQPGTWELAAAGTIGSVSTSTENTVGGRTTTSDGEAQTYLGFDFRVGFYVAEGLSIEPEIYLLAVEKIPPTFNLGGNLSYTFTLPASSVKPFLIAGYGVGNGIPLMQRLVGRTSDKLDIPVLRVGGGLKFLVSPQVALKVEYRYERYSLEDSITFFSSSYSFKQVWNYHTVLFGFSVFLPDAG